MQDGSSMQSDTVTWNIMTRQDGSSMNGDTMKKLKRKNLEQGRVLEPKCRRTKVNAQGSKNEKVECSECAHDWETRRTSGFTGAIVFDRDVSEFVGICERGAMD